MMEFALWLFGYFFVGCISIPLLDLVDDRLIGLDADERGQGVMFTIWFWPVTWTIAIIWSALSLVVIALIAATDLIRSKAKGADQ